MSTTSARRKGVALERRLKANASSKQALTKSPRTARKAAAAMTPAGKKRVARHVDAKVAARNSALNAMGGVKVDVFVRVRPPHAEREADQAVAASVDSEKMTVELLDAGGHSSKFKYDKVYGPEASQSDVYGDCVEPIVEQVASGLSCCIFAYGQTGAGKTHTMRGDLAGTPEDEGIIQRSLRQLLARLEDKDYSDRRVRCTFLEIYNEELVDLFVDPPKVEKRPKPGTQRKAATKLRLVDNDKRGCICHGLVEEPITDPVKVMALLSEADKRCQYSETKMNKMSNRAHRIFTLIADFKRNDTAVSSTLTFVDLAGSEDISKSGAKGLTAREASHINKSLLTLGRVINALACNEKHIPYRDSKLTRLLSEALGGVCKTSFIACVSPCDGSRTETNSTLRYAERAMEALNISQLPRWKQDEIMIDGLTRRVQTLLEDMERMRVIHVEEVTELTNERDTLRHENRQQRLEIGRARRKNERLLVRKTQLKSGYAVMTQHRDREREQKESLQAELLETRSVRDGYLADRVELSRVMEAVRLMREQLLAAHRDTEGALTKDALVLRGVIEGAVVDIDGLHSEVARKKALSTHNEKVADGFRDRISEELRDLVQVADDFRGAQDDSYRKLADQLQELRSTRQRESGQLKNELARVAATVKEALDGIINDAEAAEAAAQTRVVARRDEAQAQQAARALAVDKLSTAIMGRLDELRAQADSLESTMGSWADATRAKLQDVSDDAARYAGALQTRLAALSTHARIAADAQTSRIADHRAALGEHLRQERRLISEHSEQLSRDIGAYVARMLSENSTRSTRRIESAVAGFDTSAEEMAEATAQLMTHTGAELGRLEQESKSWRTDTEQALEAGRSANVAAHTNASGLLRRVAAEADAGQSVLEGGVSSAKALAKEHLETALSSCTADSATATKTRDAAQKAVTAASKAHATNTSGLRALVKENLRTSGSQADDLEVQMDSTREDMRAHVAQATEGLFEAEADAVNYVMQEIKRDTLGAPLHKDYVYPTEYAATAAYGEILSSTPEAWAKEAGILTGSLQSGEGTDYRGERGAEDRSGLLTSTVTKQPEPEDKQIFDTAAHQSEVGEYSDPEDYVEELDDLTESSAPPSPTRPVAPALDEGAFSTVGGGGADVAGLSEAVAIDEAVSEDIEETS